jgi:hypothetical protein
MKIVKIVLVKVIIVQVVILLHFYLMVNAYLVQHVMRLKIIHVNVYHVARGIFYKMEDVKNVRIIVNYAKISLIVILVKLDMH